MEAWSSTCGDGEVDDQAVSDRDLESVLWWWLVQWRERRMDGVDKVGKGRMSGVFLRSLRARHQIKDSLSNLPHQTRVRNQGLGCGFLVRR